MVLKVQKEQRAQWDLQVPKDALEPLVPRELQVQMANRENQGKGERLVGEERMDSRVVKETGAHKAPLESKEHLVLKEDPGDGASQVYLDQRAHQGLGVLQDTEVPLV